MIANELLKFICNIAVLLYPGGKRFSVSINKVYLPTPIAAVRL